MTLKAVRSRPSPLKLELNREYPQPDEDEVFAEMAKLTRAQMKTIDGRVLRAQHAKATGCVTATFRIADDVPADLRHGIFREPGRSFDCLVRFSHAQGTFEPDGKGTVRGMAIKLLDVDGNRAIEDGERTQDFLLVNHPVFHSPHPVQSRV